MLRSVRRSRISLTSKTTRKTTMKTKTKKTMIKKAAGHETKKEYRVRSFMSNVNKLDTRVHRQTHDETFGTVALVKAAYEDTKTNRRSFSVKNSKVLKSGRYSFAGLRNKLLEAYAD